MNDNSNFENLFNKYKIGITLTMFKMVNNKEDAEDLTLEAFTKAFKKYNKYNKKEEFSTWLYRIAVNNAIDFIRKKRLDIANINPINFEENINKNIPTDNSNPMQELINSEKRKAMEEVINSLPPQYKEIINLRFKESLSYKQIAEKLNIDLGTVKGQLARARKLFTRLYESSENNKQTETNTKYKMREIRLFKFFFRMHFIPLKKFLTNMLDDDDVITNFAIDSVFKTYSSVTQKTDLSRREQELELNKSVYNNAAKSAIIYLAKKI